MVNIQSTPTQKALAEALGMSQANVTKLKGQGMPVDSVASAQAWRESRQNVAARKPAPAGIAALGAAPAGIASLNPATIAAASSTFAGTAPQQFDSSRMPEYKEMPDEDHQMARTRREIAEANLAEMREAEERGKLIRVDAVRSAWAAKITGARDALLQIPSRIAPVLAAESDLVAITALLEAELRQALGDLSTGAT